MKIKMHIYYKYVGDLGPADACSLVGVSVSVNPHISRLVDYVCLLVESLTPPFPSILPPTLLKDPLSSTKCLAIGLCFNHLLDEVSQKTLMLG